MCLDPKFNIQLIIETLSKTPTAIFQSNGFNDIQWIWIGRTHYTPSDMSCRKIQ